MEPEAPAQLRKRARQSCDNCKTRKTKCIGVEKGVCDYCRSNKVHCEFNLTKRKRPFYRVSEEAYESSIKLLRRFVSEEELPELTTENIEKLLCKLENPPPPPPAPPPPPPPQGHMPISHDCRTNGDPHSVQSYLGNSPDVMRNDKHPLLQEARGCMVLDSLGKYRYVGADSALRWHHAVRTASKTSRQPDSKLIPPLTIGPLPPAAVEKPHAQRNGKIDLPSRQLCMRYAERFFSQIHCLYWFYSPEQFYTALNDTLENQGKDASSSWLCSLYSIFALGSMSPSDAATGSNGTVLRHRKQSSHYLTLAKEMSLGAVEEADVESVKAFALMSLATHGMCYSLAAYLHIGTAVRIGYSLGLHRDIVMQTRNPVEQERARRLWWTLYIIDYEMATRFGYPSAVVDTDRSVTTALASEQVLDPGPNMPLGYQALSVALVRLKKTIRQDCFFAPTNEGGHLPLSRVTQGLGSLERWLDDLPAHFHSESSFPPQHRRSIAVLHLRYWNVIISLTRPFLLILVFQPASIKAPSRKCHNELIGKCIEAAEKSVQIIKRMTNEQTLSSQTLFDCHCIMEVMWVLVLALQYLGKQEHRIMLKACLETISGMERMGWCEKISPELEIRVRESGVLEPEFLQSTAPHQIQASLLHHEDPEDDPIDLTESPHFPKSWPSLDYMDLDFNGPNVDSLENFDLNTTSILLNMFAEAPSSGYPR